MFRKSEAEDSESKDINNTKKTRPNNLRRRPQSAPGGGRRKAAQEAKQNAPADLGNSINLKGNKTGFDLQLS